MQSSPHGSSAYGGEPRRTPLGQCFLLVFQLAIAVPCLTLGQQGNSAASIVGVLMVLAAAMTAGRWLRACQIDSDARRQAKRLRSFGQNKGSARRGNLVDAKAGGLTDKKGFPLGWLAGKALCIGLEKAIGVFGPAGSGKSNLIVEFLLTLEVGSGLRQAMSVFCTDVSMEGYATTGGQQERLGREALLVGPGVLEHAKRLGVTKERHGVKPKAVSVNPFAWVLLGPDMFELVQAAARIIHPGTPPQKAVGNQAHFDRRTWQLLALAMIAQLAVDGFVTLAGIRMRLMQAPTAFKEWVELMAQSDFLGGLLRDAAQAVLGLMNDSPEEFRGGMSQAIDRVEPYAPGTALGECTMPGFDLAEPAKRPIALYLCTGLGAPEVTQHWMGMMVAGMFETIGRGGAQGRVVVVLEEAPQLGWAALNGALRAAATLRKSRVTTIWCAQDASQYETVLGRDASRTILSQFATTLTFAIRDHEHAKRLSARAGQTTVAEGSMNLSFDSEGVGSKSYSGGYGAKPVLSPSEIMTLPKDRMVVVHENLPVFVTEVRPYYETPQLKRLAGPNPYYES
jgi:type IV secretory pathway TraG/TraD family ATPase VirD4